MTPPTRIGLAALAALTLTASCDSSSSLAPLDTVLLEQILADSASGAGIVGAQAAVLVPGRQAWNAAWGRDDTATAMRPDLLVSVAQVTETFTAALIFQLAADGALDLDDPLSDWLPAATNVPGAITVRQLLAHRSGLYPYTANPAFINETQNRNRDRIWTPPELLGFVGAPGAAPGAAWQASGTNYVLLGMIAEAEVAQPLGTQVQARLLGPAGLGSTWFPGPTGAAPARPVAHSWTGSPGTDFTAHILGPSVHTSRWAALGMLSTAGDLARWMQALLAGSVISAEARAIMLAIAPDDGSVAGQVGAGLGVRAFNLLGRSQYGHGGTTGNGSALVVRDEGSGITVAVVLNQGGATAAGATVSIAAALLEAALADLP